MNTHTLQMIWLNPSYTILLPEILTTALDPLFPANALILPVWVKLLNWINELFLKIKLFLGGEKKGLTLLFCICFWMSIRKLIEKLNLLNFQSIADFFMSPFWFNNRNALELACTRQVCAKPDDSCYPSRIRQCSTLQTIARSTWRPQKTKKSRLSWSFLHNHLTSTPFNIYRGTFCDIKRSFVEHSQIMLGLHASSSSIFRDSNKCNIQVVWLVDSTVGPPLCAWPISKYLCHQ